MATSIRLDQVMVGVFYIKFLQCMSVCLYVCNIFLPWQQILISQPKIKTMTQNFQDMILGVYQGHPCCQGWPCPPSLPSGTLNVLHVPPFLTPPLLDTLLIERATTNFQDIFHGVKNLFMMSVMTMSSMFLVRNPQHPPSTLLDPTFLTHF